MAKKKKATARKLTKTQLKKLKGGYVLCTKQSDPQNGTKCAGTTGSGDQCWGVPDQTNTIVSTGGGTKTKTKKSD